MVRLLMRHAPKALMVIGLALVVVACGGSGEPGVENRDLRDDGTGLVETHIVREYQHDEPAELKSLGLTPVDLERDGVYPVDTNRTLLAVTPMECVSSGAPAIEQSGTTVTVTFDLASPDAECVQELRTRLLLIGHDGSDRPEAVEIAYE